MYRPLDTPIAARAVSAGLVLVTDNVREFRRVLGLHREILLRVVTSTDKPNRASSRKTITVVCL